MIETEHSAKKSLLEPPSPYKLSDINQSLSNNSQNNPQPYLTISYQYDKFSRLKDKSLTVQEQPLPLFQTWLTTLDKKYQVFYPQSKILLAWNFVMVVAILFNFFEIPMALFLTKSVYESEVNTSTGLILNTIFLLIFYIDMFFFNINTAYYQKGKLIKNRLIIAKKYTQLRLWIDLISTLVLTIYIASGTPSLIYLKFLFYIKIYSLLQIDKSINHYLELHRISFAIFRLVRIILFIWFITTWVGCIFFAIDYHFYLQGGTYYTEGQLWLTNSAAAGNLNLITNFSWDVWYQYALYWALQTSSTIGYGDLTPMNPPEVLYCCFVMLLMTVLFAFFINTVWEVISQLQLSSIQYSQNWQNLKLFLGGSVLPSETKQKISNYLYQVWQDNDNEQMEQIINDKLSKELKEQFYVESRWKFFDSLGIFLSLGFEGRGNRVLGQLAHQIEEIKIGQKQFVYHEGDFDDSLYYIKKGKIRLQVDGSNFSQQCSFSESFGAIEVFLRIARTQNAQALLFCKLWTIKYSEILSCTKRYPLIHEKFCEITQKILLTRDISTLNTECWNCRNASHSLTDCPAVNRWRKAIYGEDLPSEDNIRKPHHRENLRSLKVRRIEQIYEKVQPLEVDKVKHTVHYLPYFNIKK